MGAMIGKKGANLKTTQEEFEVRLDLLRSRNAIRIRGEDPEKVEACKKSIQQKLASMVVTAVVPVRGQVSVEHERQRGRRCGCPALCGRMGGGGERGAWDGA